MTKDEFVAQIKTIVEFKESLPAEFMECITAINMYYYGKPSFHLNSSRFVEIFETFKATEFNGKYVELRAHEYDIDIFCLYPTQDFIERFGVDRLPTPKV